MGVLETPSRMRPVFWIALLAVVAGSVESGAYAFELFSERLLDEPIRRRSAILREQTERIRLLLDSTVRGRQELDSVLGWRYRPGYASDSDHLTMQGLRGLREYAAVPAEGTLRVAAFGDSFVYGNEVSDPDAWCARLEAGPRELEVLNYGVGGYGVDQAFLRFQREGMALDPHVVLIGFAPDDLRRIVNVYRRFISSLEWPLAKPRFTLRGDGTLAVVPNPLPGPEDYARLLEHPHRVRTLGPLDGWYPRMVYEHPLYDLVATLRVSHALWTRIHRRYFDRDRILRNGVFSDQSSAFALQVAVFGMFAEAVRDSGAVPAVVMLPDGGSVERLRRGLPPVYDPMVEALRRAGATVWDAGEALGPVAGSGESLFAPGGHYSAAGNRVLAEWLRRRLDSVRAATRLPT